MGRADVHERGVVAEGEEPKAEAVEDVYHSGDSGVLAERDDALARRVDHFLVVDQTNLLLEAGVEQCHVVGLGLNYRMLALRL